MAINFNKTSLDSIAVWTSNSPAFKIPIILSTGTGIDNFLNIDQPVQNIIVRTTLNGNTYSHVRQTRITGSATFHPQSSALSSLRDVTQQQQNSRISLPGTLIIINIQSLLEDTYKNLIWTNPYSGSNRNHILEDVTMTFNSDPPTSISLGSIASALIAAAAFGISSII